MSGPMKIRGNTEFRFPLNHIQIVSDSKKQKKATAGALAKPWQCTWT